MQARYSRKHSQNIPQTSRFCPVAVCPADILRTTTIDAVSTQMEILPSFRVKPKAVVCKMHLVGILGYLVTKPQKFRPNRRQMTLSPLARRITYVVVFEIFAIAFATILLATLSGGEAQGSLPVAVASSVAAVVWNFIYNTLFERWERLRRIQTRSLGLRVVHAAGFEFGLIAILIPLFMFWYQVGPFDALVMQVALLIFFLVFTFVFTLIFDYVVPIKREG